jgi:hypothetical protein
MEELVAYLVAAYRESITTLEWMTVWKFWPSSSIPEAAELYLLTVV